MPIRPSLLLSLVVVLAGSADAMGAPSGIRASGPLALVPAGHERASAARALARRIAQPLPYRDLYTLTDQLRLRPPRPIARVARTTNSNFPVGHEDQFYILSDDENHFFTMTATIRAKTRHLYLYLQNGVKVPDSALQKAANRFEQSTYPTDRVNFGSEWIPGVDGDPHITCLVGDLKSARQAGSFSAEDEYVRAVNPYSNQRELFYINAANTLPGQGDFDLTLAHEFQHMIHWHMHPHESLWLNEGMSMLAEELNGFSADGEAGSFLAAPKTQLDTWSSNDLPHYGAAYLFLSYLHQRFGRRLIRELLADKRYTDMQLVDDALRKLHIHATARSLFAQWVAANYIDDRSVAGDVYAYKHLGQQVNVTNTRSVPFSYDGRVPPYAADYTELDGLKGAKPFRLSFSAPTTIPIVGVTRRPPFWWSNRGDMTQTTMSRDFDLRRVKHAHLKFRAWWDIEKDYDYAYVEVSRDGGKTYDTLRSTDTTTSNPNAANYGNGFTGGSGSWRNETVDLSRYAGHRIKLRFQYITDDGVNGQSLVVQGISLPEIGFHDHYSGWKLAGFVPITSNAVPSDWMVQLVAYSGNRPKVTTMSLSPDKHGAVTIDPVKEKLTKLVVVVFTTAPKTTVETRYQLTATR